MSYVMDWGELYRPERCQSPIDPPSVPRIRLSESRMHPIPTLIEKISPTPYTSSSAPGFLPGVFVRDDAIDILRLHVDGASDALW